MKSVIVTIMIIIIIIITSSYCTFKIVTRTNFIAILALPLPLKYIFIHCYQTYGITRSAFDFVSQNFLAF